MKIHKNHNMENIKRIADSLERAFPLKPDTSFFEKSAAFIWDPDQNYYTGN